MDGLNWQGPLRRLLERNHEPWIPSASLEPSRPIFHACKWWCRYNKICCQICVDEEEMLIGHTRQSFSAFSELRPETKTNICRCWTWRVQPWGPLWSDALTSRRLPWGAHLQHNIETAAFLRDRFLHNCFKRSQFFVHPCYMPWHTRWISPNLKKGILLKLCIVAKRMANWFDRAHAFNV